MPIALIGKMWTSLWPYLLAVAIGTAGGWMARGTVAERDMLRYQQSVDEEYQRQLELKEEVEKKDEANTQESTDRVDQTEAERVVEVKYVDRKVVEYIQVKRDDCPLPAEWVCIYNSSLGLPCESTKAGAAGP